MIIVTGHLRTSTHERDAYLRTCVEVVRAARATAGCLDFALSADLLEPDRINVLEVWATSAQLADFRGAGIGEDQGAMLREVSVSEHEVA